jgi:hypothetical protein
MACACAAPLPAHRATPGVTGSAPPRPAGRCTLGFHKTTPQDLRSLEGLHVHYSGAGPGGPRLLEGDEGADGSVPRAAVWLSPDGIAEVTRLPSLFGSDVWLTSSHALGFRFSTEKQQERLVVVRRGSPEIAGELDPLSPQVVRDAADGVDGASLLALGAQSEIGLVKVDRAGHASPPVSLVAGHEAQRLRIARETHGDGLLLAWSEVDSARHAARLWLARVREDGSPLDAPFAVDTAPADQPALDVALASTPAGAVVAWDPITGVPDAGGPPGDVPLEVTLRAFAVHAAAARPLGVVPLTSMAGPIASVGGFVLSNDVRAAPLADDALITWSERQRRFATLAHAWSPVDIGPDDGDAYAALFALGDRRAAFVWVPRNGPGPYPTLYATLLDCVLAS